MTVARPDEVLAFWFGEPGSPDWCKPRAEWFTKSDAFDAQIRERFGATVRAALDGGCEHWCDDPQGALAYLIALDQFTRNIHRGTPTSFAGDPRALAMARRIVERGWDKGYQPAQRSFCYLPFEHSESAADQQESLRLFDELKRETGDGDGYEWALKHQQVIERFGRFPHRNEILGRRSTAEEIAFLEEPGSRF
ncbi:MAG TPA: DUF924 family protein [Burkholderiaceae bacterium]|nr:DUF924 family protein [Burkholderiaceae bacterium]